MSDEVEALLGSAGEALEQGDWELAKSGFERLLDSAELPEAEHGLGTALMWLGETREAARHHERAYKGFVRRPDPEQAAFTAIDLTFTQIASLGSPAGASGWFGRAQRLIAENSLEHLRGWELIAGCMLLEAEGDREGCLSQAYQALELARESGDRDLELCALATIGDAKVQLGEVEEGLALLDEAMAGSLAGEGDNLDTVIFTSCTMMQCCGAIAEFSRLGQWLRAADEFHDRYGSPHLYTRCRLFYARYLICSGRWPEAEKELELAISASRTAEPALHAESLSRLAELRLAQGRIEQAARLLEGLDDRPESAPARAALGLVRGDLAAARSSLEQALGATGSRACEEAAVQALRVELELAAGDQEAAVEAAETLGRLREHAGSGVDLITARAELALGQAHGAAALESGDESGLAAARSHVERALAAFAALEMPYETSRCRIAAARLAADRDRAVTEARKALEGFERVGAGRYADDAAALLRSLGVRASRTAGRSEGGSGLEELTKREREVLELLAEGLTNKGIAERLFLSPRTVEHHVRSVLSKLGLSSRSEAAAFAVRHLSG